jgi:RNA polymerase sigma-70 factor (ECF subfamily)
MLIEATSRGGEASCAGDGLVQEASDLELLRSAGGGDDDAFHALVDRHAAMLFRVAQSLTRNRADAEDLLQETFVGAYRGLKSFAGRSSVKTWLVQILTRQAAKAWHRSRHHRNARSIDAATDGAGDESNGGGGGRGRYDDDRSLTSPSPTAAVDRRLDVMAVLKTISAPHREVLVLREIRGLSYEEIAQVLEVPRGTVESRLSRARAEFRATMTKGEGADPPS